MIHAEYLDVQYIYLFAFMLAAHYEFSILFTSENCFFDFKTYDFREAEPTTVLQP